MSSGRKVGSSLYTDPGSKEWKSGMEHPSTKKVKKFCEEVLAKYYDSFVILCKDTDVRSFKEVDGSLMSGLVVFHPSDKNASTTHKRAELAMLLLDAVEGFCDDDKEVEDFLRALADTAEASHRKHSPTNEELKIATLKELLLGGVDFFDTYKGKEGFLKSCLASIVPSKLLEVSDESTRKEVRRQMKEYTASNGAVKNPLEKTTQGVLAFIDTILDEIDNGASAKEINEKMKKFRDSF